MRDEAGMRPTFDFAPINTRASGLSMTLGFAFFFSGKLDTDWRLDHIENHRATRQSEISRRFPDKNIIFVRRDVRMIVLHFSLTKGVIISSLLFNNEPEIIIGVIAITLIEMMDRWSGIFNGLLAPGD